MTSLWCCHRGTTITRVHLVHLMNAEQHHVAATFCTKLIGLSHRSAYTLSQQSSIWNL